MYNLLYICNIKFEQSNLAIKMKLTKEIKDFLKPDSVKLEINTRLSNIFKFTKTPDVSFDNIKGLNQVSGVMLKMLFMDAHIKVLEKEEIWDDFYERRFNLLKTYVLPA